MNLLYIHGYGSNGNAKKGQILQQMFPAATLISPTLDYDNHTPQQLQQQLQQLIADTQPALIVGSSFGGYHALCASRYYKGPIWMVNPVREAAPTLQRLFNPASFTGNASLKSLATQRLQEYREFDANVFLKLTPCNKQLNFALSTDDEVLGDHTPLLSLFPNYNQVVWKDHCGHHFMRFSELKKDISQTL